MGSVNRPSLNPLPAAELHEQLDPMRLLPDWRHVLGAATAVGAALWEILRKTRRVVAVVLGLLVAEWGGLLRGRLVRPTAGRLGVRLAMWLLGGGLLGGMAWAGDGVMRMWPIPGEAASIGLRHDVVTLESVDGVAVSGLFVAGRRERALMDRPAVLLVPGGGHGGGQLAHLVGPLHAAGFHVMLLEPRGTGESGWHLRQPAKHQADVAAAFEHVRHRAGVGAVAVVASGDSSAAAIALPAAAVVLHRPPEGMTGGRMLFVDDLSAAPMVAYLDATMGR